MELLLSLLLLSASKNPFIPHDLAPSHIVRQLFAETKQTRDLYLTYLSPLGTSGS